MKGSSAVTSLVPRVEIVILNGPQAGQRRAVPAFPCIVGRGGRSHLALMDPDSLPTVSREHFTLSLAGAQLMVTDHSVNGTQVGCLRLSHGESTVWRRGEELQVGPTLRLLIAGPDSRCTHLVPQAPHTPACEVQASHTGPAENVSRDDRRSPATPDATASPRRNTYCAAALPRRDTSFTGDIQSVITSSETLRSAWKRVALNRGAAGPDNVTVADFAQNADRRLADLRSRLLRGRYQPMPPRLFAAPKRSGGVRTIAILNVEDRVVQQALHTALQPLIEPSIPACSFAYRPGASARHALRAIDILLQRDLVWIGETDIAAFFDGISHRILLEKLEKLTSDAFALTLAARCIASGAAAPGRGIPQGGAASPLLSNLYLADFDVRMLEAGHHPVRYGDDLVFACGGRSHAHRAIADAEAFLRNQLQLSLQPEKTRVVHLGEGFTFLGFHFNQAGRKPGNQALQRLEQRLVTVNPDEAPAVERGWRAYFGNTSVSTRDSSISAPDETAGGTAPATKQDNPVTMPNPNEPGCPGSESEEQSASVSMLRQSVTGGQLGPDGRVEDPAFPRSNNMPVFIPLDEEGIERFLSLFVGRKDVHARVTAVNGKRRFTPCTGPITPALVRRHLCGTETLATYLVQEGDLVSSLVLDIDAVNPPGRPPKEGPPSGWSVETVVAAGMGRALQRICRSMGIPSTLEDSGHKGFHLWIFFDQPVAANDARRLGQLLRHKAGDCQPGVRVEILPRHSDWPGPELGDSVKLPLGVNPSTGRRCFLLDEDGSPIVEPERALECIRTFRHPELEPLLQTLSKSGPSKCAPARPASAGNEVDELLHGCNVVRSLVQKARDCGHLRHTHNLILLYTAGRLGETGTHFIHSTLSQCRNYNVATCQRYIDQLKPDRHPISCHRIREWLEEDGESGLCTCSPSQRTPLDGIPRNQDTSNVPRRASDNALCRPSEYERHLWQEVAADIFESGFEIGEDAEENGISAPMGQE